MLSYYFRKEIDDFGSFIQCKYMPYGFDQSISNNEDIIDQLIEYGFQPSSIEYCLKYDVIDDLVDINILNQKAIWSPFEWSSKPEYLDLLSFSGFFGSIKCFKHLLLKGFKMNENTRSMVVCGGCLDLFHLCQIPPIFTPENVCRASEFCHLSLLTFMSENGTVINSKDNGFGISYMIELLFILLLKKVILVLLNSY